MNPKTHRLALYVIGAIAILASANALAHSYAGLYDWAVHQRLTGWQAKPWPAEIDVFPAVAHTPSDGPRGLGGEEPLLGVVGQSARVAGERGLGRIGLPVLLHGPVEVLG